MNVDFDRGLIIVEPYGTYIRNREKNLIVKSKYVHPIIDVDLLLIENKLGLGIIKLGEPTEINLKKFSALKKYHKITDDDRKKWWNRYKYLYAYPIIKTKFFKIPILLNYSTGPQITVLPNNIFVKKIFIGMCGYYYKYMYPKNTRDLLDYYSENLNSVEINSTFYNFPKKSTIETLEKYNLVYSIKVNQFITHQKKLKGIKKYWNEFYSSFSQIHDKIHCFLFQFSPKFFLNEENYDRLKKLSKILSKNHYYAFEFRDLSWFGNDKINKLFKKNKWMIVIVDVTNVKNWAGNLIDGFNPPLNRYKLTSDAVYFRLHGTVSKYRGAYTKNDFNNIFEFIKNKPIKNAFVYFNNTDSGANAMKDSISLTKRFNPNNTLL